MRKAKDDHQGQIIYTDKNDILAVKPVYAHASIRQEMKAVVESGGKAKVHCFVRSKCLFRLCKQVPQSDYGLVIKNEQKQKRTVAADNLLEPAMFMLNTIVTKTMSVEFSAANGCRMVAPLRVLIEAGFEVV